MSTFVPLQIRAAAELERRRRASAVVHTPYQSVKARLPVLYDLQEKITSSSAKRKVIATGRRVGKTVTAGYIAVTGMLDGKKVLYCSTSQDQTDLFWERIKDWTFDAPGRYKNETKRIMEIADGRIRAKTGSNPDVLRGEDADLLILDECAYLDPDAWFTVGSPMLLDRDGSAYFFSTPNRKNWFFQLFQRAKQDTSGRWAWWHAPTHENPHLSKEALAEISADMTADMYQQEILAQFLESGGEVFRHIEERATAIRREPYDGQFVGGLDWAQKNDFTVLTVMDRNTHQMVDMDRFNGVDWSLQRGRVKAMVDKWKIGTLYAESNSIGSPNIEALQREGMRVYPFETTAQSKPPLIESLALAFEREGEIAILDDGVLLGELAAYERKVSLTTGRSQFSAPEGLHDDCVISLALAWYGCMNDRRYGGIHIR